MVHLQIYTKHTKVPSSFNLYIADMSTYLGISTKVIREDWDVVQVWPDVQLIYEHERIRLATNVKRCGRTTIILGGEDWDVQNLLCNENTQEWHGAGCMCT